MSTHVATIALQLREPGNDASKNHRHEQSPKTCCQEQVSATQTFVQITPGI
tara:strand:+ start:50949 stop:51101 length:153 start_codon:yes stop_codon:yes gene_type:complete